MDRRAVRGRAGGRVELSDDRFLHCRRRDAALVPALDRGRWRADRRSGTRRGRGSRGRIARTGRGAGCTGGARMRDRRTVAHLLVGCRAQRQELRLRTVYETGRAGGRRVDAADDGRRRGVGDGYDLSFLGACRTCRRDDLQCVGGRRVGGDAVGLLPDPEVRLLRKTHGMLVFEWTKDPYTTTYGRRYNFVLVDATAWSSVSRVG